MIGICRASAVTANIKSSFFFKGLYQQIARLFYLAFA